MQPNTLASNANPARVPSRLTIALLALKAMLLSLASPSSDALPLQSRRAMLKESRMRFANTSANSGPVKDIAIGFILIGVALVVALAFWPAITSAVATAQADTNTTGSADTVLGLLPLILAVALLVGAIAFLFRGLKGIGGS